MSRPIISFLALICLESFYYYMSVATFVSIIFSIPSKRTLLLTLFLEIILVNLSLTSLSYANSLLKFVSTESITFSIYLLNLLSNSSNCCFWYKRKVLIEPSQDDSESSFSSCKLTTYKNRLAFVWLLKFPEKSCMIAILF